MTKLLELVVPLSEKLSRSKVASLQSTKSVRAKVREIIQNISVEPMLALYVISSVLTTLASQNINLEKACRVNLRYETHICDALSKRQTANYTDQERTVQQAVASMNIWRTVMQSSLPALLILFVGSWSDRWGRRKPCMLLPLVGELMTALGLIVCNFFFYELPMEVAGFVEGFFPAITGGWFTMFMGAFAYIGDVSSLEKRTLRVGVANVFINLGITMGLALSGILYTHIGLYGICGLSAAMYTIAFYYGYVVIKEPPRTVPMGAATASSTEVEGGQGREAFWRDFFHWGHLKDTFAVVFRKREGSRRMQVILLIVAAMVVVGPVHGELHVTYLFTRYRFNWNELDFSLYSIYNVVVHLFGTVISLGLFSSLLKFNDSVLGLYASISKIMSSFVYCFAISPMMFYFGSVVDFFNGTAYIAVRAITSKLVPSDELGTVLSLFGACEALMPLIYGPLYNATYALTIGSMPGAYYLLGGVLTVPAVVIFGWIYNKQRALLKEESCQTSTTNNCNLKSVILSVDYMRSTTNSLPDIIKVNQDLPNGITNPSFQSE